MKAQDYIQSKLDELQEPLGLDTLKDKEQLIDAITKFTLSKKFRKYSVTPESLEQIKSAIKLNVRKNEPIKFVLPFGAYKLWRLDETPEADWAEFFAMMYYTKWMKPLCEVYEPGVWFDFFSDDVIVKRMNNIPTDNTKAYRESFKKVLEFIKPQLPKNLNMTFNRVADRYESQKAVDTELERNMEEITKEAGGKLPALDEEQKAAIELNVKTTAEQEKDPEWREKVQLILEAYGKASKRRPYYRNAEKIMVVATPLWGCLCVGTTKDSIAKFWCGAGALKPDKNEYRQLILTPSQLKKSKFTSESVNVNGLPAKNFTQIRILL
jgi:hypothetical protein